jgi:hypothetical protein
MASIAGTRIGPYEIVEKLGQGGPPSFGLIRVRTSASLAEAKAMP